MTAPTMPTTAAELEDYLGTDAKALDLMTNPDRVAERREWLQNYARAANKSDTNISVQIREETQRVFAEMMRENGIADLKRPDLTPVDEDGMPNQKLPNYKLYNKYAKGAVLDKEYEGLGAYLKSIWRDGARGDAANMERLTRVRNAFGSAAPSDGGFLVPEILRANLLRVALETAVVRPRAMVLPMDSARVPFPSVDSTTNVGSVYGGITTYWTEEGAALTASSASFGRVILDAKKLTAYAEVPTELIQDSVIAFEAFLAQVFPEALAFSEDIKFMAGTGTGEPLGFINGAAAIAVAKQSGQPTKTIVWENLVGMYARMLPASLGRGVWIASIDTFPQLATMALSVGTGGGPVWMGNYTYPGANTPPVSILGRPVFFTEKASVLGTVGDINFVDLGYYLIGDRQMMTAADSQDYKFANDLTAFRFTERLDGRPWIQSAITPANGGPTLSPIVQLATR